MRPKIKPLQSLLLDDKAKKDVMRRLNRIEGQIKGLQRMVEEDRPCLDVLIQVSSVQETLRSLGKLIMRGCLEHCVTSTAASREKAQAERLYGEFMELLYKYSK